MDNMKPTGIEDEYKFPDRYLDLRIDEYRYFWLTEYLSYIRVVKNLLKPFIGQKVLEVGCGEGRFCYEMKSENVRISGLDKSKKAIDWAKSFNPELDFWISDIIDFKEKKHFDDIVMIETLEHIPSTSLDNVLKKVYSLLKENGRFIIKIPSKRMPLLPCHEQHFSVKDIKRLLRSFFKIETIVGHSSLGLKRWIYLLMRNALYYFYPFRVRFRFLKRLLSYPRRYYKQNLEKAPVNNSEGLIVVCRKI
jgi:SAM-dependent methyltransferase